MLVCGFDSVMLVCGFDSVMLVCGFDSVMLVCGFDISCRLFIHCMCFYTGFILKRSRVK